jgi:hypothetical protein
VNGENEKKSGEHEFCSPDYYQSDKTQIPKGVLPKIVE